MYLEKCNHNCIVLVTWAVEPTVAPNTAVPSCKQIPL